MIIISVSRLHHSIKYYYCTIIKGLFERNEIDCSINNNYFKELRKDASVTVTLGVKYKIWWYLFPFSIRAFGSETITFHTHHCFLAILGRPWILKMRSSGAGPEVHHYHYFITLFPSSNQSRLVASFWVNGRS